MAASESDVEHAKEILEDYRSEDELSSSSGEISPFL